MPITTTLVAAGTTALLKRALDDVYLKIKEVSINQIGRARSDLKEAAIARALSLTTKVKTLWNVEREVSLYDFYYPSSISFSEGAEKKIGNLKELGSRQNYVIQGTAGQGKSIFLRYLCGQELMPASSSNRVPIFIELRRVRTGFTVQHLILEALQKFKLPFTDAAWDFLASSGKFVLLMDAFDEVDPELANRVVNEIEGIAELYGTALQIIITSRPDADIQRSSHFRVCKLAPLDRDDHLPFLKKICPDKGQAESLMKVLQGSSTEIRDLLTTPLMMTLLVILYKSLQTVPDTVPRFYEELFDVLFYRHDHSKPGFRRKRFTQLDDSKIKKLFSAFCFYVRLEGLGVLTNSQFETCLARATKACDETVDPTKFKDELVKTVCLMQQDGFEYSFIHKSVTQYYAASFVRSSSDDFAAKFYELASKPGRNWDLELRFLAQIDTFRYTKWHEITLLNKAAYALQYSFGDQDDDAASRLNDHLLGKISLVFREREPVDDTDVRPEGKFVIAWSHVVDDDPVLNVLGRYWAGKILAAASLNKTFSKKLLAAKLAGGNTASSSVRGERELCLHLKDQISAELPDLGEYTIDRFKSRYEAAMQVLKTEEEKTAMLAALL